MLRTLLVCAGLATLVWAQEPPPPAAPPTPQPSLRHGLTWAPDWATAKARSQADGKPVLLYFTFDT